LKAVVEDPLAGGSVDVGIATMTAVQGFGQKGCDALLAQDRLAIAVVAVVELVGDVRPDGVRHHVHADGIVGRAVARRQIAGAKTLVETDCCLVQRRGLIRPLEIVCGQNDTRVGQGWSVCAVEVQAGVWDAEARDVDAAGKRHEQETCFG
jgi:hypothetical protein